MRGFFSKYQQLESGTYTLSKENNYTACLFSRVTRTAWDVKFERGSVRVSDKDMTASLPEHIQAIIKNEPVYEVTLDRHSVKINGEDITSQLTGQYYTKDDVREEIPAPGLSPNHEFKTR